MTNEEKLEAMVVFLIGAIGNAESLFIDAPQNSEEESYQRGRLNAFREVLRDLNYLQVQAQGEENE